MGTQTAVLIGKKIDEVDLKTVLSTSGHTRSRVWDPKDPMMGDCEFDTNRLNLYLDHNGTIEKITEG